MQYHDGTTASLGDVVDVGMAAGTARARIVMLGDTYEHLDIDRDFLSWVTTERKLSPNEIVVEWIEGESACPQRSSLRTGRELSVLVIRRVRQAGLTRSVRRYASRYPARRRSLPDVRQHLSDGSPSGSGAPGCAHRSRGGAARRPLRERVDYRPVISAIQMSASVSLLRKVIVRLSFDTLTIVSESACSAA